MSTIVTRAGKGSALTHNEVDANFTNLNTDKLQSGNTAAALTITSATIAGGTINDTTVGATTPAAGTFTDLTANNSAVVSVNTSSNALRITQTGTGNALVVEDDTNPDSTPFVVNSGGNVGIGTSSPTQLLDISANGTALVLLSRYSTNSSEAAYTVRKARGTDSSPSIVASGDTLVSYNFQGYDGASFLNAARIIAQVDGTPGTNDMPGRLVFSTTADGSSSPTERLRIDSAGDIDMAATSSLQKNSINAYTLKNITYLTSGTAATYTTPAGVRALKVTVVGGGGGGGGVDGQATANTNAYSNGGGGAGYAIAFIAAAEASYTYTVGAGGTGGAAGNNAGATGGTTEFKNAGATVVISSTGGAGGLGDTGATSTGAASGVPGVGSITGLGTPGGVVGSGTGEYANGYGRYINGQLYSLAGSGYCPFIGGGVSTAAQATGTNATNYGEGGGQVRTTTASASNFAGGDGFAGLIIVEEYY